MAEITMKTITVALPDSWRPAEIRALDTESSIANHRPVHDRGRTGVEVTITARPGALFEVRAAGWPARMRMSERAGFGLVPADPRWIVLDSVALEQEVPNG